MVPRSVDSLGVFGSPKYCKISSDVVSSSMETRLGGKFFEHLNSNIAETSLGL